MQPGCAVKVARPEHIRGIVGYASQWFGKYPRLRADLDKVQSGVRQCVSGAQHYAGVTVKDGEVVGALLVLVNDHLWAQRKQAHIVFWASDVPGTGAQMLRDLAEWARPRRAIRLIGMAPDLEVDERALKLAERIGFERHGGAYLHSNGG